MLVVVLAAFLLILFPAKASALSGFQYDGTNPESTGCYTGATTQYSKNVDNVTIELRFSWNCYTAWARVTCNSGDCTNYTLSVVRNDGSSQSFTVNWPYATCLYCAAYTNQLYDLDPLQSQACYSASAGGWCTNWY